METLVQMNESSVFNKYKGRIVGQLGEKSIIKCDGYSYTIVCNPDEYTIIEEDNK